MISVLLSRKVIARSAAIIKERKRAKIARVRTGDDTKGRNYAVSISAGRTTCPKSYVIRLPGLAAYGRRACKFTQP